MKMNKILSAILAVFDIAYSFIKLFSPILIIVFVVDSMPIFQDKLTFVLIFLGTIGMIIRFFRLVREENK